MLLLAIFLIATDGGWELVRAGPPATVEKRALGDGIHEIRVSMTTDVAGEWIADAYWNERTSSLKTQKRYNVLSKTASEKVAYLQLHLPLVKDRDYSIRILRYVDPTAGLFQFTGRCIADMGPPPSDEYIRVNHCFAQLTIEPSGDGRTAVTYVAFANPEGHVPKWIVNAVAPNAVVEVVEKLIALGRERAALSNK